MSFGNISILHVDDEPDFATLTAEFLAREDERFTVATATSAEEGLAVIAEEDIDCIVSDYDMPGQNGIELLDTVREDYPDLPFLLFTGKGSEEVASKAFSKGATDYLQKDSGTDQYTLLANKITNYVEKYRAERTMAQRARAMETANEGIALVGQDGHYIEVNQAYAELYGTPPADLIGRHWTTTVPDEEVERLRAEAFTQARQQGSWTGKAQGLRADGSIYAKRLSLAPLEDGSHVCIIRDLSDSKARERAIDALHRTAREFMQAETPDAVAEIAVSALRDVLDLPATGVHLYDDQAGGLVPVEWTETTESLVGEPPTFEPGDSIAWEAYETGEPQIYSDISSVATRYNPDTDVRSQIVLPLDSHGVLVIGSPEPAAFDEMDIDLARTLATHATATLDRMESEQALREERAFIDQALDTLTDLFYVLDTDGTFRRWNDRVSAVTGYTDAELTDMQGTEIFPEDERDRVSDAIAETLATGATTLEADIRTAEGDRLPYEFTGASLTDPDGNTTGVVGVGRDLTMRQQREQRFQALVEESNDIISIVDVEGRYQYQSPSIERILGYEPEETVGDLAWEYIHPDDREAVKETFEEWVTNSDTTGVTEYRARAADGSWRWMQARGNNQLDNPAVEGYVVNSRDITEQKERQRDLQTIKQQYQTLVENFPHGGVFLFGTDFRTVRAGGQELSKIGLSPDEIEGTTPRDLYPADIADELMDRFEDTLHGAEATFEQELNGERYRIRTVPVRSDDGAITHGMAVSMNITEQVADRRALERQNERLDEFASIVSHDLRNPLNVAHGRLELLAEECESEHIDAIDRAHIRMETLIDDLLTLARQGNQVRDTESVDLGELVQNCWQTIATGDATIVADIDLHVQADRSRLQQLFENLMRNAIEHGGADVTITIGQLHAGFYVEDDGSGIPPEDQEQVFETGYSTARNGTGFGLSIVKQVVDAHTWDITMVEGEHGGARFEITGVTCSDQ
jgi:PAS domain S-box-containing protein